MPIRSRFSPLRLSISLALAISLAGFALTYLKVGDPQVRVANCSFDDHAFVYAQYLSSPNLYSGDPFLENAQVFSRASLLNLMVISASQRTGIAADTLSYWLLFLQNALLGLGLYRLGTLVLGLSTGSALVVALGSLVGAPWAFNLAYFPDFPDTLYPGQFVLPFLVWAVVERFRGAWQLSTLWLLLGGWIHPALTVGVILLCGLSDFRSRRTFPPLLPLLVLGIVLGVIMVPPLLSLSGTGPKLPSSEVFSAMRTNGHFFPWETAHFWKINIPAFLSTVGLALAYGLKVRDRNPLVFRFVLCGVFTVGIMAVAHLVSAFTPIVPVLRLIPLRVTVPVLALLFPVALALILSKLEESEGSVRGAAGTLASLMIVSPSGVFWPHLIALFVLPPKAEVKRWGIVLGWFLLFLLFGRPIRVWFGSEDLSNLLKYLIASATSFDHWKLVGAYGVGLLGVALTSSRRLPVRLSPQAALLSVLLPFSLWHAFEQGRRTELPEVRDSYEAMRWVSMNTPPQASVVIPAMSFRAYSQRRTISAYPIYMHLYTGSKTSKDLSDRVRAFLRSQGAKEFEDLNTIQVLEFVAAFGGDYVVWRGRSPLELPVAYQGAALTIYRIAPTPPADLNP